MATTSRAIPAFNIKTLLRSKDMIMAGALITIIGTMIVPLPSVILDLFVVLNLALSIGVILLAMYIARPMDFSVFPSVLLLITLFRLSLNISASRSILSSGNAGKVISTFGSLVVGSNYVVGVVIFLMLTIIQFVVITNGASRVAEVAARFTLDAMPGKQLSIDADLNAGIIDENQARMRRMEIETEADFYGAMDGASKFVRGDAIAAVIVMLVNIIGGFIIGIVQRNMTFMDALQGYVLLTVGAGLAIQIPALIVSSASGLIVTRSTSELSLGSDVIGQLSNLNALTIGAAIMVAIGLVPGLPKLPFMTIAAIMGFGAYSTWRAQKKAPVLEEEAAPTITEPETPQDMLEMVVTDPIEIEIGYALIPLIDETQADNLLRRITGIRRQVMNELGVILPIVRVRDNLRLSPQSYRIKIRREEIVRGEIMVDRYLAIPTSSTEEQIRGTPTTEPAFGLPAYWISEAEKGRAELLGYTVVNPLSVLSTHLTEVVRNFASDLLSRQMVQEMIDQLQRRTPAAVDGVIPELITLSDLQSILRSLLRERVPIRDFSGILEVIATHAPVTRNTNVLAEAVRQTMARTLSNQYRDDDGYLHVFTIAPQLEETLRSSLIPVESGVGFQLDAGLAQQILVRTGEQMEKLAQAGHYPILLCPREIRLAFRKLVEQSLPNLVVLAFSEVSTGTRVKSHGMISQE
ncbi:MAG: flagellar biosynthesis protein FlhA [Anaerolineales bacterium]|nr:flagellar biosynthesis protein FlhA [Anaerolineales bacterium]